MKLKTQVAIIGGGPAGLLLGQILSRQGIDAILIERQSPEYVLTRIRAGILEQGTVNMLNEAGVGTRLMQEGIPHEGLELGYENETLRLDLPYLTNGKTVTAYGQTEITKDMMDARTAANLTSYYSASDVTLHDYDSASPSVRFKHNGMSVEIECDFIAGCDGYHGVCRQSVPKDSIREFERVYPFGWIGLLADTPPVSEIIVYSNHEDGFLLCSMRSHTRSRYYLQCSLNDHVDEWTDARFWGEFSRRLPPHLAHKLVTGPSIEKSIAPLRSFVAEPLRFGRLFLAGDAGHIVPPTGAKGLNLAASDIHYLSNALIEYYHERSSAGIDDYSRKALNRIWKTERFSWWLTTLLHRFPDQSGFEQKIQRADFEYLMSSENAQRALAENYVGLAF